MRPDFGSGLLGARLRAEQRELAATTQYPRAGGAAAAPVAPDRGAGGRGRARDDARAAGHGALRRAARPQRRTVATFTAPGSARMRYPLLRRAPPRACCKRGRHRQRDRVPRGAATAPRRPARCASARCSCACCGRGCRRSTPDNVRIDGGERIRDGRRRVGAPPPTTLPAERRRRRWSPASTTCRARSSCAPTARGDFSLYTLRARRRRRQRRAARRLRPAAVAHRVLVQGRVPDRLRLRRQPAPARPQPSRAPDDRLPGARTTRASAG